VTLFKKTRNRNIERLQWPGDRRNWTYTTIQAHISSKGTLNFQNLIRKYGSANGNKDRVALLGWGARDSYLFQSDMLQISHARKIGCDSFGWVFTR
jgi:hypothetical protein